MVFVLNEIDLHFLVLRNFRTLNFPLQQSLFYTTNFILIFKKSAYVVVCPILPIGKAISAIGGVTRHNILKWVIPVVVFEAALTQDGVGTHLTFVPMAT